MAASRYPIRELGNCKNAAECRLYCQIPQNTPACWSYNKYILNKNVLGDSTVNLSFPIEQLNNCASARECFEFCSQTENRQTCQKYGEEKGLIKAVKKEINSEILEYARNELGCTDRESCKTFCVNPDNAKACSDFALKHSLKSPRPSPAQDIVDSAKKELECTSYSQCVSFCESEENRDKCLKFAKDHNLISSDRFERERILKEKMQDLLETAKEELDCDTFAACAKKCQETANREKCEDIAQQFSLAPPGIKNHFSDDKKISTTPKPSQTPNSDKDKKPCTGEEECREYCRKNPKDCPGYLTIPTVKPGTSITPKPGEYLGPGGCKTNAECEEYCKKHPSVCPGFPKPTETKSPTTTPKPSPTHVPSPTVKPSHTPVPTISVLRTQSAPTESVLPSQSVTHAVEPTKPDTDESLIEITLPPKTTTFGILNNTPIPVPEIN